MYPYWAMSNKSQLIITSSDASFKYLSFLPLASACHKLINDNRLLLVLNLPSFYSSALPALCRRWTETEILHLEKGVDARVQAKISRMWVASSSRYQDEFITLCDIDMIQLDALRSQIIYCHDEDSLIQWGYDHPSYQVDPDIGKWPMDGTSGRGKVFLQIVNPHQLSFSQMLNSWSQEQSFDKRSNPYNSFELFSDESLLKDLYLRQKGEVKTSKVSRLLFENEMLKGRLDKTDRKPIFAKYFLQKHQIHEYHGPRPFDFRSRIGREILRRMNISIENYVQYLRELHSILKNETNNRILIRD